MDIYCKYCAEPWEHDTLHEFGDYTNRCALFVKYGCNALMNEGELRSPCKNACIDEDLAAASALLQSDSPYSDDWLNAGDLVNML